MNSSPHIPGKRPDTSERMKRARPNRMKKAQVMPPHHVDLTLAPDVLHDVHVPAHVSGADLSKGGPEPAVKDDEATVSKPSR